MSTRPLNSPKVKPSHHVLYTLIFSCERHVVYLPLLTLFLSLSSLSTFAQNYQTNGTAVNDGNGLVKLTAEGIGNQTATAWSTTKIDLAQPFDMSFEMFFGCDAGPNGGDGMTFTLHNDPRGLNAMGEGFGFLGLGGGPGNIITPAVSIEFDTYDGSGFGGGNEIPDDHIAIDVNGDVNLTTNTFIGSGGTSASVQPILGGRDLESCAANANNFYTIRITWDPVTKELKLYEEGTLTLTYTKDMITDIFGGTNEVYWGFTAATGNASNEQWIAPVGTIIPWQCSAANSCCTNFSLTPTGPTTVCNTPITIGLADPYTTYSWSTGQTTPSITIVTPGTYTVTVQQLQGGNLCPGTADIVIAPNGPTATITGSGTICNDGSTMPLSVSLTGTAPWTLTYAIDGVDQPTVTGIASSPYVINATSPHTYTLTDVTSADGCPGVTSGSSLVDTYAGLPEGHDGYFTPPGQATLTVTDDGGTYEWWDASSAGNLLGSGLTFQTPVISVQTTYYLVNTAISAFINKSIGYLDNTQYGPGGNNTQTAMGGPRWDLWLDVTANSNFTLNSISPDVNITADPQSGGTSVSIWIVDNTAGTTTQYTLPISGYTVGIHNVTVPINFNFVAGQTYRVSYEGAGNAQGIMYWDFVGPRGTWGPNPPAQITKDPEATITVPGQGWYPGMFNWQISMGSPASTCGRTPVTAYPCPTGILSGDATICNDGVTTTTLSVALTQNSPWTITYAIDGVAQAPITGVTTNPYVFQSATGAHTYTLTALSNPYTSGCTANTSGSAVVSVYPGAPTGHDATFTPPGTAQLSVDNSGGTYNWYDASTGGNLVFTGNVYTTNVLNMSTTFYVEQVTSAGASCTRTPVTATAVTPVDPLFFPNLVTPNADGNNDAFVIKGLPSNSRVTVYNSWGSRVYDNKAYQNDWVPEKESDGMYYYEVKLPDGNQYQGWLHVIR